MFFRSKVKELPYSDLKKKLISLLRNKGIDKLWLDPNLENFFLNKNLASSVRKGLTVDLITTDKLYFQFTLDAIFEDYFLNISREMFISCLINVIETQPFLGETIIFFLDITSKVPHRIEVDFVTAGKCTIHLFTTKATQPMVGYKIFSYK